MKNLFNQSDAAEIINRIEDLQPNSTAQWGKMNVGQMLAHCQAPFTDFFSKKRHKRGLMGILFGGFAKKKMLHEGAFAKNLPTDKNWVITDERDFQKEKQQLIDLVKKFSTNADAHVIHQHPFFGKMNGNEWSVLTYKHLDHHLRQFGV